MTEWIGLFLDVVLIAVVGVGIAQAMKLIAQLKDLRASRSEMDRFVRDFNGAVMRAEAGIKSLRAAARESGDDLEKLVNKAIAVRDELTFIVESADGVAERLSVAATSVMHPDRSKTSTETKTADPASQITAVTGKAEAAPASKAEKELLQALLKLK